MTDRRAHRLPALSVEPLVLASLIVMFVVTAIAFATRQNLWTDEATQLSGVSLHFAEQLRWLAGRLPHLFAVPLDRTPPLSYWLGSLWAAVFGHGILAARCLSVSLSVVSILVLYSLAHRTFGRRVALVCAALLAVSPNFLVEAVEIRAYAAFIVCSILLLWSYLRLLAERPEPSSVALWAFGLAAALCSYTHYFGILISAGTCVCVLAAYAKDSRVSLSDAIHRTKWPLLFYLFSIALLLPLVLSAVRLSSTAGAEAALPLGVRIHDALRLAYRLFAHQSMLGVRGLSGIAALSGLMLIGLSATPGAEPRARQVLLLLAVNLSVVGLAGLTAHGFNAFSPSYNSWALPLVALLGGAVLRHRNVRARYIGVVCLGVLLAADGYGAARLAAAGEIYAHTRSTALKGTVDQQGPGNVIVLYLDDAASTYFAMEYYYDGELRQYVAGADALRPIGARAAGSPVKLADLDAATLLVACDQQLSAEGLQFLAQHADAHTAAYQALDEFLQSHRTELTRRWVLVSRREYLAQSALAFAVLKRRASAVSTDTSGR